MDGLDWEPPTEAEMKLIEARRERSDRISKLMSGYLLKGYKMLGIVCPDCDTILLQDRQGTKYCVACSELESDTDKDNPLTNQCAAKTMVKEMELSSTAMPASDARTRTTSQGLSQQTQSLTGAEGGHLDMNSTFSEVSLIQNMSSLDAQTRPPNPDSDQKVQNGAAVSSDLNPRQNRLVSGTSSDSGYPSLTASSTSSRLQQRKRPANTSQQTCCAKLSEPSSTTLSVTGLLEKIDWASDELKDTASVEYSIQLCHLIKAAAEAVVAVRNVTM